MPMKRDILAFKYGNRAVEGGKRKIQVKYMSMVNPGCWSGSPGSHEGHTHTPGGWSLPLLDTTKEWTPPPNPVPISSRQDLDVGAGGMC